ncbi:MAG: hypothetical protein QF362_04100 [Candidatus Woesearchaeota archaeon]|jgi:hypothetical protein|nr:hypothetical protein [Candidatus Woesearchaeota archaeon]MDP7506598.1 hypothetical protein [Candidatus Woesearchaeota archaeon]MDP7610253.1 hypothetical protein [Candidatus Woesearchaeota archaeon]|tara:strand:+ start:1697 stop:2992 length:1296 start_codon:yes stop_codon:yes gene_type:complete
MNNQKIMIELIKKDPLKYLPKSFLGSKRVNIAKKTIREELNILKEYSENKISYSKLAEKYNFSQKMVFRIMKRWGKTYPPNLDKVFRCNNKSTQSILQDLKICKFYLSGNSIYKTAKEFNLSPKGVQGIIERYGSRLRNSYRAAILLHKTKQLNFPLTPYVQELVEKNLKKYSPKFIAVLTLTDGCCYPAGKSALKVRRPKLSYCGDKILCKIYADLVYEHYNIIPSTFTQRKDGTFLVLYERKDIKRIIRDLLSLTPNFKTSLAHGEKIRDYLKTDQPTLRFLLNDNKKVLLEAFRLGMSAEGSCSICFNGKYLRFSLDFSCAHPILLEQWREVAYKIGINFNLKGLSGWFNYSGLSSGNIEALKTFMETGGFIDNVKITRQSKYYNGLEKNKLIYNVLRWNKENRRINSELSNGEKHKTFYDFIEESEY